MKERQMVDLTLSHKETSAEMAMGYAYHSFAPHYRMVALMVVRIAKGNDVGILL